MIFTKTFSHSTFKFCIGVSIFHDIFNKRSLCKINNTCDFYFNYLGISKKNIPLVETNIIHQQNSVSKSFYGNCGEDAYFLIKNDRFLIFGVADGVGGWNKHGIDPSKFSGNLVKFAALNTLQILDKNEYSDLNLIKPNDIMFQAYNDLLTKTPDSYGSSTACFVVFDKKFQKVFVSNLGDSGFFIYKLNQKHLESKEQCHYFNCPFQLSLVPSSRQSNYSDQPHDAINYEFDILPGEFIIVATDGVWDNLDMQNLNTCFNDSDLKSISENLFQEVIHNSNWDNVKKRHYKSVKNGFYGAKNDDVTLILAGLVNS